MRQCHVIPGAMSATKLCVPHTRAGATRTRTKGCNLGWFRLFMGYGAGLDNFRNQDGVTTAAKVFCGFEKCGHAMVLALIRELTKQREIRDWGCEPDSQARQALGCASANDDAPSSTY